MKIINMIRKNRLKKQICILKAKSVELQMKCDSNLNSSNKIMNLIELEFKNSYSGDVASNVWLKTYLDDYLKKYNKYKARYVMYRQDYLNIQSDIELLQKKYDSI